LQEQTKKNIFGGYADQNFFCTNQYKHSTKAFVFDLNKKKKYSVKSGMEGNAIYGHQSYGACFGGSEVIFLQQNSPTVTFRPQNTYSDQIQNQSLQNPFGGGVAAMPTMFQASSIIEVIEEMEEFKIHYEGIKKVQQQFQNQYLNQGVFQPQLVNSNNNAKAASSGSEDNSDKEEKDSD